MFCFVVVVVVVVVAMTTITTWWQLKYFLFSPRTPGEMIQFDEHICFKWVVQPPTRLLLQGHNPRHPGPPKLRFGMTGPKNMPLKHQLGGGFKYFYFHPYLAGEDSHFD